MDTKRTGRVAVAAMLLAAATALDAQQADTARAPRPDSAASTPTAKTGEERRVDLSGVIYANFNYRTDDGARAANRFDLERAYLTFRAPLGERASVRVTADVFQQQDDRNDDFYRGWVFRAKYAYLQYDWLRDGPGGMSGTARFGMLHNVVIEHIEGFWPRWISTSPPDRWGFFSSSDLGVAAQLSLPNELGELYATVVNGPGYTSRETDRFKDYAARLTITPLAGRDAGILESLTVTGWGYKGARASRFVDGGAGQVGPVGESLRRDRWGLFAGVKDRRLTAGAGWDRSRDEGELGANTPALPRAVADSAGRLLSAFAVVRPVELVRPQARSPLVLLLRVDRFEPDIDRDADGRLVIAGAILDVSSRLSLALDYQEQLSRRGASLPVRKSWFLHAVASF